MAFGFAEIVTMLINGLVIASTLFIVASGLSIVFGVSRISNFAHGSLYMVGAYVCWSVMRVLPPGILWFFLAAAITAVVVGILGLLIEMTILRRLYHAPHHLQLIATFGVFLILRDLALMIWGPQELFPPRVPGLSGMIRVLGRPFLDYYFVIIGASIAILLVLLFLFHRTRWGVLLRAATQDREMVAALGVDQKWLFTGVFVLSAVLAGLGGALDTLRVPASLGMDITVIIDAFAVVVIGGMGSIIGCFIASLVVGILTAAGTILLPQVTLALVFIVMATVLIVRPKGFFGKNTGASWEDPSTVEAVIRPANPSARLAWTALIAALAIAPFFVSEYVLDVLTETVILVLFAWSFYFMAGPGGMISFGQAAFFGIGLYAPALLFKYYGIGMTVGLIAAPLAAGLSAAVLGWFAVRSAGIYFAMLTLAFAQILWSVTFQWFELTNGELGILGIWADGWAGDKRYYYLLCLAIAVGGILMLRRIVFAPFGYSLRAGRDSELRSEATGIKIVRQKWLAFVISGTLSGMAGGLMLYLKGSAFPSYVDIQTSFDAFVMALLGGLQSLNGPIVGAVIYRFLKTTLQTHVYHWNMVIGGILILIALFMPRGLSGVIEDLRRWRGRSDASSATVLRPAEAGVPKA
jgi:branched-chain amino acid transport system permease protein